MDFDYNLHVTSNLKLFSDYENMLSMHVAQRSSVSVLRKGN